MTRQSIANIHSKASFQSLPSPYQAPWSYSAPPRQPPAVVGARMWSQLPHRSPGHRSVSSAGRDATETPIQAYLQRLAHLSCPFSNGHYWGQWRGEGLGQGQGVERGEADGAPVGREGCWGGTGAKTRGCLRWPGGFILFSSFWIWRAAQKNRRAVRKSKKTNNFHTVS